MDAEPDSDAKTVQEARNRFFQSSIESRLRDTGESRLGDTGYLAGVLAAFLERRFSTLPLHAADRSVSCDCRHASTRPSPGAIAAHSLSTSGWQSGWIFSFIALMLAIACWQAGDRSDWCDFKHARMRPRPGSTPLHSLSTSGLQSACTSSAACVIAARCALHASDSSDSWLFMHAAFARRPLDSLHSLSRSAAQASSARALDASPAAANKMEIAI